MGRLLPPVDITNDTSLSELDKRISIGPVTVVFVYADWCGHCQRIKPDMEKLENIPGRSVQIARIRDDMLPKSSLSKTKISGYPSLLLIKKNGEATTFQDENGEVSNVIPDYRNMNKMATLVRNAGKDKGMALLEQGPEKPEQIGHEGSVEQTIVTDRLTRSNTNNITLKTGGGKMNGGGLWYHLYAASKNIAPAAVLLLGSSMLNNKKSRRTKKTRKLRK